MGDAARGRRLEIAARRVPTGPVVVAVTLVTAACASTVTLVGPAPSDGAGGGGQGPGGGAGLGGGGAGGESTGFFVVGGASATSGPGPCDLEETFFVEVPPEGIPAQAGQICAAAMGPVESNQAARVTLLVGPGGLEHALGKVTVAPALLANVVGLPTIEVVSSPIAELQKMKVTNLAPTPTGFSFDADWPPLSIGPYAESMMIVRTTFDLACGPGQVRQVEAHTHVNLCLDEPDDVAWVSSGDECTICGVIAEMAPSPIVPDRAPDELALGRVIRLGVVVVARIGAALVLLAEHDAGAGVAYTWVASAGDVRAIAPDIVLWTPPAEPGPHFVQVAVESEDAAAVASYTSVPVREAGLVA